MNEHVRQLLQSVPAYDALSPEDSSSNCFEAWLGLTDGDAVSELTTIEDNSEPLPTLFWESFNSLLIWAYHLPLTPLESEKAFVSLEVIQVSTWLRYCLDLHISSSNPDDSNKPQTHTSSFTKQLLCSSPTSSVEMLLEALYHHVHNLSQLQSVQQIYIQSLRSNMNTANRLEAFQEMQLVSERLQVEFNQHVLHLECILGDIYECGNVHVRSLSREYLATYWHGFAMQSGGGAASLRENTRASGIAMTLRLLLRICKGVVVDNGGNELQPSYRHLLFHNLLPLHQPNGLVLWRDQTALLDLYHEPLVQCMAILLRKEPTWLGPTLEALLTGSAHIWNMSNTPKILLLLHEVDTLLQVMVLSPLNKLSAADVDAITPVWPSLLSQLCHCMASDNSRLSERALQFFRNERFRQLFDAMIDTSLPFVLKAVMKPGADLPWNPTVRKMTYNVLQDLYERHGDEEGTGDGAFGRACQVAFGEKPGVPPRPSRPAVAAAAATVENSSPNDSKLPSVVPSSVHPNKRASKAPDFSLKAGMGDWRPPKRKTNQLPLHANRMMLPPQSRQGGTSKKPPSTVTGVAPWSAAGRGKAPWSSGQPLSKQPPLTVTGVAPWAMGPSRNSSKIQPRMETKKETSKLEPAISVAEEEEMSPVDEESPKAAFNPALGRVLKYMEDIKPPPEEKGASVWSKKQMEESPTLLPSLKFHDLVFGHDLGAGAFGSVRYARRIDQAKTRSHWAEYAVKIISTQKIVEMGYEASVQREIATLRVMSHPGIARLISSFRFRDGAYLVLEYASQGDLHMLLRKKGSLDQESARFVVGEVVAALCSIHELGFVYGDLKTENTVITETGHIKLTDFGACRPITPEAIDMIQNSAKNLIKELRNGDWKSQKTESSFEADEAVSGWSGDDTEKEQMECEEELQEDLRIEGTTAYLPPEVVLGSIPTRSADMWALGCILYQCLTGRPPLLADDDEATRQRIVTFDHSSNQNDGLFGEDHAKDVPQDAKLLILRLLSRSMTNRPTVRQVVKDPFFNGKDVLSLYHEAAHPLDVGTVAPVTNAKWGRRQLSSIWAPQPKAYDISPPDTNAMNTVGSTTTTLILEGDEASSFFSYTKRSSPGPLHLVNENVES